MQSYKALGHPNTFDLLQSLICLPLTLREPQGGQRDVLARLRTPLVTQETMINMAKGIMKGSCWDLEKDPCAATGHTPPLVAGNTHCLKRASISGDEKKRQVTTPHLIGIHIAITVKETAAGDVIQRHVHPTAAITEVYMIALVLDHIVEGEAGTVRTEVTQGAILELSPEPPTVSTEVAQEADLESSLTPPTVSTEDAQGAVLESTPPTISTEDAQEADLESTLPTIRTEVAQGAILESTPAPHIRHHGMMNMAGKRNTKQSIMRNPLANC